MSDTVTDTLTSVELCERLDITYRQLDYACRMVLGYTPGSGHPDVHGRRFDREDVHRFDIAAALANSVPTTNPTASLFVRAVEAVFAGPVPPPVGWVMLDPDGKVHYIGSLIECVGTGVIARVPSKEEL